MLRRLLALIPIVLVVVACETTSEETGAASGGGAGSMPSGMGGTSMPSTSSTTMSTLPAPGGTRGSLGTAEAERELVSSGDTVYFAFDSYSLDGQAQEILDRQAAVLLRGGGFAVTIEGHTDERGTREYNLALGDRRATAVKDYLVAYGIPPSRIRTLSYGEERPAVVGSSEQAWAKNRRAVTIVVGGAAGS
jgi:peptidoglycan-associated lipoprotein